MVSHSPAQPSAERICAVSVACRACPVVGGEVWSGAATVDSDAFIQARTQIKIGRGKTLFSEGDAVDALYVVISGAVVLYRPGPRGRPVAIHLVVPGHTVGFRALAEGGDHRATARCPQDSILCRVPVAAAEAAFAVHRPLERVFLRDLTLELRGMRDRLLQISCLGVRDRLMLMLGRLIRPYATEIGEGWLIANPLARTDMAALAGMTPETISRCIKQLEQEDAAYFSRRTVLIPSRERMAVEMERLQQ